ncbi:hypothetical protein FUAG_00979 [Fusobacterium ulcerans ATCC 49185]|nr:hypothetical protein FUAG_00979 [Fusobacterium ulcerans ATCC 49185]
MIEKIMKAVKSNNKKRGRNITVGAVVGMLLSCTVVMGENVAGLEIITGEKGIEFSKDGDKFTPGSATDPYSDNTWTNNTYTNNSIISGTSEDGEGYGIYVKDSEGKLANLDGNLRNNGEIAGKGSTKGYGIYVKDLNGNLTNNGKITGEGTSTGGYGISILNALNGSLTNNGKITSTNNSGTGTRFGIRVANLNGELTNNGEITAINSGTGNSHGVYIVSSTEQMNLTNNGEITASATGEGYGVYVYNNFNGTLTNNGKITGTSSGSNFAAGVREENAFNGTLTNNGEITGIAVSTSANGIYPVKGLNGNLTNNGKIIGISTSGAGFGMTIGKSKGSELINNGIIAGTSSSANGHGIYLDSATDSSIANTGVIYGSTNAIFIQQETIKSIDNYGLLVTGRDVINDRTKIVNLKNYGLAFKVDGTKYSASTEVDSNDNSDFSNFGTISGDDKYTVINAKAIGESATEIEGTDSITLKDGSFLYLDSKDSEQTERISSDKKYVLNGITDTLKVSGWYNKLNDSIVNAYETAVVMGEDKSMLTLDNTIVNGGMKEDTTAVNITGTGNEFIAKGNSVINTKADGVAITVGGNNNAVVLEGNAIVNGKMEAKGNGNILDLDGTGKYGMNMHYDISGFEKMAIDNNVTFSEDMKVTGTKTVAVEGTGVLNLRLKKAEGVPLADDSASTIPKATHAFSKNGEMTIEGSSEGEAGTLNFITNGIGREILVDMEDIALKNMKIKASSIIDTARFEGNDIHLGAGSDLGEIVNPKVNKYNSLNKIYKSIYSSREENIDGLRDILSMTYLGKNYDFNNATDEEQLANLLTYLNSIYSGTPYSYSSELSRRSIGMFRDIITENEFRPNLNNWLIMGGLTHADGGTKDTYYGRNYHEFDTGSSETSADMKLTGAYMLAKYGYSENTSLGLTLGGNKSEAKLDMAKVKGNSGYLGAFAENYRGNLTLKAGAGVQYSEYDADRRTTGDSYSDKYSDMAYDIYLNGRYSNPMGDNFFLEPYGTLSYTYVDQDGADEGNKTLAIETDSKSFDYTVGKVGLDLKKVIPHEKGKSTLTAGVSYTKIFDGADEENITGRFKGGSDFDIIVAHKNEHSIGLNAKYALELESGVLLDVKGTYSVERDSHNGSAKKQK